MKQLIAISALMAALTSTPAQGETETSPDTTIGRFFELLEQFSTDSEDMMEKFMQEMGPALSQPQDTITDWSNYSPPEVLPNGDIIIRRKPDAPREKPLPEGTKEI